MSTKADIGGCSQDALRKTALPARADAKDPKRVGLFSPFRERLGFQLVELPTRRLQ